MRKTTKRENNFQRGKNYFDDKMQNSIQGIVVEIIIKQEQRIGLNRFIFYSIQRDLTAEVTCALASTTRNFHCSPRGGSTNEQHISGLTLNRFLTLT